MPCLGAAMLGCILAWTQPLKNGHDQNSFSEKHKNTVFLVTLAITTSDTNTTICGRARGRMSENVRTKATVLVYGN